MSPIKLQLFGTFSVQIRDQPSINVSAKKSQALLTYLAVPQDKVHQRDQLAALLWSQQGTSAARTNLRQALAAIRKALGNEAASAIVSRGQGLILDSQYCECDVQEFESACSTATTESLELAVSLYRGELLEGMLVDEPEFETWLHHQRTRLHERYMFALNQLLMNYESAEQYQASIEVATTLLRMDGLQEPIHRALMRSYAATGRRGAAQQQYQCCCDTLMQELGLKPDEQTRQLYRSILSQPTATHDDGAVTSQPIPGSATTVHVRRAHRWQKTGLIAILAMACVAFFARDPSTNQHSTQLTASAPQSSDKFLTTGSDSGLLKLDSATLAALSKKPSIAVLPFSNNGDEADVYFSDGLSEDLITELSRLSGLRVVARRSSFSFRERSIDSDRIAATLGVRYLLDGSIRRNGERVRINASLVDSQNGLILWAERYDEQLADVLTLQDSLTARIVEALSVSLTESEQRSLNESSLVDPKAYDLMLRGLQPFRMFTAEGNILARQFFTDAIDADPLFARAYANLALTYGRDVVFRYTEKQRALIEIGLDAVATAESLQPDLPQTQFALAVLSMADRKHDQAVEAARKSIYLEPNYADGYAVLAQALGYSGLLDESLHAIQSAKLLNPLYPFGYLFVEGHIRYQRGEYEKALPLLRETVDRNPNFIVGHLVLAANYAQLGLGSDAQWQLFEVAALDPRISLASEKAESMYLKRQHLNHLIDGLEKAGLRH